MPYRHQLLFSLLIVASAAAVLRAQEYPSDPGIVSLVLGSKQAAKLIVAEPAPQYPPIAKANYVQGKVKLEVATNPEGHVVAAHVVDGSAVLAASALQAVRRWIYRPMVTPNGPSGFVTLVEVAFRLRYDTTVDLPPRKAEQDFLRRLVPSRIVRSQERSPQESMVHVRLLVDDHGQVVDRQFPVLDRAPLEAACKALQDWTFRPAYWGNLPVASYLEVDVPVSQSPSVRTAANLARP